MEILGKEVIISLKLFACVSIIEWESYAVVCSLQPQDFATQKYLKTTFYFHKNSL